MKKNSQNNKDFSNQRTQQNNQKKTGAEKIQPKGNSINKKNKPLIPSKGLLWLWIAVIVVLTAIAYSPTFKNEITNWDDDKYITENPFFKNFDLQTAKELFTNKDKRFYMGNYHPLSMISLSIDYKIGGIDEKGNIKPLMFHVTQLLLHIIALLLVFWFVLILLRNFNIAVVAGVLFGVHALHVESIAWLSERKDVLYTAFFVAALVCYVYFVRAKTVKNQVILYVAAVLLYLLSLFSKGQAVTLALSLVAVDFVLDRKLLSAKVISEKVIFFVLAAIFGYVAIQAQKAGEAMQDIQDYEFYKRIGFAGYGFTQYLIKLVLPVNLSSIYPYPDIINRSIPNYYWLFMIPAVAIIPAFIYTYRKSKVVAFSIAFFVLNIALLLQLIPVGSAIYADRYAYIPSIGYCILVGFGFQYFADKKPELKNAMIGFLAVYVIILGALTFQRSQVWKDSPTLWEDVVNKQPKAVVAWNNRGSTKDKVGKHAEAIEDFTRALEIKPDYAHAFYNRGTAKKDLGNERRDVALFKEAIADFDQAIRIKPSFSEAYHNRGIVKDLLGQLDEAIKDFDLSIQYNSLDPNPYVNRGVSKGKMGKLKEAIVDFQYVIDRFPTTVSAYSNRGLAKDMMGDTQGALDDYSLVLKMDPKFVTTYTNRGLIMKKLKKYNEAIADFNMALQINPKLSDAYYYIGLVKYDMKDMNGACESVQRAVELGNTVAAKYYNEFCKGKK